MLKSKIFAITVVLTFLGGSAMAQNSHTYQGGPKSDSPSHGIQPPATSNTLNMDTSKPSKKTKASKASGERHIHEGHTYQGGPKTGVPHAK